MFSSLDIIAFRVAHDKRDGKVFRKKQQDLFMLGHGVMPRKIGYDLLNLY